MGEWLLAVLNIVWIDIVLAGDNAVVIALAVRNLEARQRLIGIAAGAGAAVVLRVGLTFVATQLLAIRFVQLGGGLMILWIALKLLRQNEGAPEEGGAGARGLWQAVWMIVVADITMSTDNILAVAGTSKGSLPLLLFGLGLSIPFVVFTSNLLSIIMDKYPIVIWIGAAILGRVGAEMIITDPVVHNALHPSTPIEIGVQVLGALIVVAAGKLLARRAA